PDATANVEEVEVVLLLPALHTLYQRLSVLAGRSSCQWGLQVVWSHLSPWQALLTSRTDV
ncbi:hypothetical protein A2U01_0098320, partial [Trifolium medium]|nr:hypothetical protein [Trifolium medium]